MSEEHVVLTVDAVIADDSGRVLVMKRETEPYKGCWVLPGGIVEVGETVEQAAIREVEEEVGHKVRLEGLLGVYSTPGRDPRGAFVSVAFIARVVDGSFVPNEEASEVRWAGREEDLAFGFDHARILADYWNRLAQA